MAKLRLGELLVSAGLITEANLRAALGEQRQWGGRLGYRLVEMEFIAEKDLVLVLSKQMRMPMVELEAVPLDPVALKLLPEEFCREHECLPFGFHERGRFLDLAMADPANLSLFEKIRLETRCNPRPHIAGPVAMANAFGRAFGGEPARRTKGQGGLKPSRSWDALLPGQRMIADPGEKALPDGADASSFEIDISLETAPDIQLNLSPAAPPTEGDAAFDYLAGLGDDADAPSEAAPPAGELALPLTELRAIAERLATLEAPTPPSSTKPSGVAEALGDLQRQVTSLRSAVAVRDQVLQALIKSLVEHQQGALQPASSIGVVPRAPAKAGKAAEFALGDAASGLQVAMDFGTTRSSVAVMREGKIHVLTLEDGEWEVPSVVGFGPAGKPVVGHPAREMLGSDPLNAVASPKRLLGRRHDDRKLEPYLAALSMPTQPGPDGEILLVAQGTARTVEEICAPILAKLREVAERFLGEPVKDTVLTIPVGYGDEASEALAQAAALAGLNITALVDEPVAAAMANHEDEQFRGLVGVYDFGGGTFDFSVVDIASGMMEVVGAAGDTWLGGDDFDLALAGEAANGFWRDHQIELRHQIVQWNRLLFAAERTKRELTVRPKASVKLAGAALTGDGPLDLDYPVTRAEFSELTQEIVDRSIDVCKEALSQAGLQPYDLNSIYLSSGTSYVPAVQQGAQQFFGLQPRSAVPPERAVLLGAALFASVNR